MRDKKLGSTPWNKGRKCTEEENRINSESHKGKRWMHLGTKENLIDVAFVRPTEIQSYLDKGYEFGRLTNGHDCKKTR